MSDVLLNQLLSHTVICAGHHYCTPLWPICISLTIPYTFLFKKKKKSHHNIQFVSTIICRILCVQQERQGRSYVLNVYAFIKSSICEYAIYNVMKQHFWKCPIAVVLLDLYVILSQRQSSVTDIYSYLGAMPQNIKMQCKWKKKTYVKYKTMHIKAYITPPELETHHI